MSTRKGKKKDEGLTTYKVRCAITMAHYRFVEAASQEEAERFVEKYIVHFPSEHGENFDWYGEASHYHVTYEVEEAE